MTNPKSDTIITLKRICWRCDTNIYLKVTQSQYDKWISPQRENIQDIFPNLTADEREILISGTCGPCYDEIWSERNDKS